MQQARNETLDHRALGTAPAVRPRSRPRACVGNEGEVGEVGTFGCRARGASRRGGERPRGRNSARGGSLAPKSEKSSDRPGGSGRRLGQTLEGNPGEGSREHGDDASRHFTSVRSRQAAKAGSTARWCRRSSRPTDRLGGRNERRWPRALRSGRAGEGVARRRAPPVRHFGVGCRSTGGRVESTLGDGEGHGGRDTHSSERVTHRARAPRRSTG